MVTQEEKVLLCSRQTFVLSILSFSTCVAMIDIQYNNCSHLWSNSVSPSNVIVPSNDLVLGALDSQSLGPGSMLWTDVCLSILSSSPGSPKILILIA